MGVPELDGLAITDAHAAVGTDSARLRAVLGMPNKIRVTGLVCDVATEEMNLVVRAALLQEDNA